MKKSMPVFHCLLSREDFEMINRRIARRHRIQEIKNKLRTLARVLFFF